MKIFLAISLFFCSTCLSVMGQEQPSARKRAVRYYKGYQYAKASGIYLELVDVKKPQLRDLEHLASCYRLMNNYQNAEIWYARAISDKKSEPENLLYYAEMLKANSKYVEAKKVYLDYANKAGSINEVSIDLAGCDSAQLWLANPSHVIVKNATSMNSANDEFLSFIQGDKVYLTGEERGTKMESAYTRTGRSYFKIYSSEMLDSNYSSPKLMTNEFNDKPYHVGPVIINKKGDIMYYTSTYFGKKSEMNTEMKRKYNTQNLELFIQSKQNELWQKPEAFPYNNVEKYSLGHAALSPGETVLYFVSDMPGGFGGTDIWFSEKINDKWSVPQNAGNSINTSRNELFPTMDANGILYFSTTGLAGMGGLDIFWTKGKLTQWTKPENMRFPVNSAADDFLFIMNENSNSVFFSSNRTGGQGSDDIYAFNPQKLDVDKIAQIINPDTLEKLSDTKLIPAIAQANSDILEKATNVISIPKKGIIPQIENIYYDFDKDNITPDAVLILNKIADIMNDDPTLKIEIASYTDARGLDKYNLALSKRRAKAVFDYLIIKNINGDRMQYNGYGEANLVNHCADKVKCPPEEQQKNRRTEFKILVAP